MSDLTPLWNAGLWGKVKAIGLGSIYVIGGLLMGAIMFLADKPKGEK
jgi:hypothetical protein